MSDMEGSADLRWKEGKKGRGERGRGAEIRKECGREVGGMAFA